MEKFRKVYLDFVDKLNPYLQNKLELSSNDISELFVFEFMNKLIPYKSRIMANDFSILNDSPDILEPINIINIWKESDKQNKTHIWTYVKILYTYGENIISPSIKTENQSDTSIVHHEEADVNKDELCENASQQLGEVFKKMGLPMPKLPDSFMNTITNMTKDMTEKIKDGNPPSLNDLVGMMQNSMGSMFSHLNNMSDEEKKQLQQANQDMLGFVSNITNGGNPLMSLLSSGLLNNNNNTQSAPKKSLNERMKERLEKAKERRNKKNKNKK